MQDAGESKLCPTDVTISVLNTGHLPSIYEKGVHNWDLMAPRSNQKRERRLVNKSSSEVFNKTMSCRYLMEKEGKTCRLIIKVCRPDDECEYACGVDERKTRARLFVEGKLYFFPKIHQ